MLTKDEWKKIENGISRYSPATLRIDGYKITIEMRFMSKTKMEYFVFVDGKFKGEWLCSDCEMRERFAKKTTKKLWTKKHTDKFLNGIRGKKIREEMIQKYNLNKTFDTYWWGWTSFSALKNHLIKHNTNITLEENHVEDQEEA